MATETVRLRIRNVANAVLITGQAYQDPKGALNEFVSNAADEYAEAGTVGGRIRIQLRRKGKRPVIAIEDDGRGMPSDRLRELARGLFESVKAGDAQTLGEKAIGLLAFQQLGGRCDIVSRIEGEARTASLQLERGKATARLELNERRRARQLPGTTIYLYDLDPDVLRVLTHRKVVDYLRRRRGAALARGEYTIEVAEGRRAELVTPDVPDGVRMPVPARNTLWGSIEFALFIAPRPDKQRRVAVVGRAGTTIIDDVAELEELDRSPWTSDQISGFVAFDALRQSAGRRAILRDREAFPVFLDAIAAIEPAVARTLERVSREVDEQVADRVSDTIRRIFGRVLRELEGIDNPMRAPVGSELGEGGLLEQLADPPAGPAGERPGGAPHDLPPVLGEAPVPEDPSPDREQPTARPDGQRARALPSLAPDPDPGEARSRFDEDERVVLYNESHPDYLLVKDEEPALLDYLASLVAKEYVVYNLPRASADEVAEELVRMLVRVRRHLPRRAAGRAPVGG